jgi:3-deoxy-7-phosphoheptulonate synthase
MLVFLHPDSEPADTERVLALLRGEGFRAEARELAGTSVIETVAGASSLADRLKALPGVERLSESLTPYRLAAGRSGEDAAGTAVTVGPVTIGNNGFTLIAGPCAVEGHDVLQEIADAVFEQGAKMLRGGAFKPRTSPYSFQGLGEEGLQALRVAGDRTGLPVVTEVMDTRDIELVSGHADMLQVGSRNMHNFSLLRELGRQPLPVLLKRGMSATLKEFLAAAEYVLAGGNDQVVLCERGIRAFSEETRNTLDLAAVPVLRTMTHLPIIVDPSHATGRADLVRPLARAAAAVGADGVMVEVHVRPEEALCDANQAILPEELGALAADCDAIRAALRPGAEIVAGA